MLLLNYIHLASLKSQSYVIQSKTLHLSVIKEGSSYRECVCVCVCVCACACVCTQLCKRVSVNIYVSQSLPDIDIPVTLNGRVPDTFDSPAGL